MPVRSGASINMRARKSQRRRGSRRHRHPCEGSPLKDLRLNPVRKKMSGPPGSTALLTIIRDGEARPIQIAAVRTVMRLRPWLRINLAVESVFLADGTIIANGLPDDFRKTRYEV